MIFKELSKNQMIKGINKFKYKITDDKIKNAIILSMATIIHIQSTVYAATGSSKLDVAGNKLLIIFRNFGKFVCLFFCFAEIVKSLAEGDVKSVGKIMLKYSVAFSSFYFLPWLFDIIKDCFE